MLAAIITPTPLTITTVIPRYLTYTGSRRR